MNKEYSDTISKTGSSGLEMRVLFVIYATN